MSTALVRIFIRMRSVVVLRRNLCFGTRGFASNSFKEGTRYSQIAKLIRDRSKGHDSAAGPPWGFYKSIGFTGLLAFAFGYWALDKMSKHEGKVNIKSSFFIELGDKEVARDGGKLATCLGHYENAMLLLEKDEIEAKVLIYTRMMEAAEKYREWDLIETFGMKALEILVNHDDYGRETAGVAEICRTVAFAYSCQSRFQDAIGVLEHAFRASQGVLEKTMDAGFTKERNIDQTFAFALNAAVCKDMSSALRGLGRVEDALEWSQRALHYFEHLDLNLEVVDTMLSRIADLYALEMVSDAVMENERLVEFMEAVKLNLEDLPEELRSAFLHNQSIILDR